MEREVDSNIGEVGDSPAEKITVTIHEYGNVMMTAPLRDGAISSNVLEAATVMLGNQTQEIREVLDICGDAEIVENFRIIEGPNVDALRRFKPLGFYGRFASANYDKLQAHFACRKRHIPDRITPDFIQLIIDEYALQMYRDDNDDEYDDDRY